MKNMDFETAAAVINVLSKGLAQRMLGFVALLMSFGLFCWAMALGTSLSLACATVFGGVIFLPVLFRSIRKGEIDGQDRQV